MGEKNSIESILEKISSSEYVLKDIAYIKQGIVSGADKYTDAHERKYHLGYTKGEGIFVLHQQEINALELSDEEREFIKEVYKNSQVEKYKINYDGELNVLYVTKESKPDKIPCIINHLQKFKPILESKRETKEGKLPWYSLHWPRDRFLFESDEKIINSRRAKSNIFALDTRRCYEQSDLMISVIKDDYKKKLPAKYVLALLNSKLYYVWLKNKGKLKGDMLEMFGAPLEEIPIKVPSDEFNDKITKIVDLLLDDNSQSDYYIEIDELIYDLFDLSPEEKEIMRNYNK